MSFRAMEDGNHHRSCEPRGIKTNITILRYGVANVVRASYLDQSDRTREWGVAWRGEHVAEHSFRFFDTSGVCILGFLVLLLISEFCGVTKRPLIMTPVAGDRV